jgi:hypothetical protein
MMICEYSYGSGRGSYISSLYVTNSREASWSCFLWFGRRHDYPPRPSSSTRCTLTVSAFGVLASRVWRKSNRLLPGLPELVRADRFQDFLLKYAIPFGSASDRKPVSYRAYSSLSKGKFFPMDSSTSSISGSVIQPCSNSIRPITLCCPFSISSIT